MRGRVCVHVDDVRSALSVTDSKIKSLGAALERHGVGGIDMASVGESEEYHVIVHEPSEYVAWADIVRFCEETEHGLEEFVLRLKFALLDG